MKIGIITTPGYGPINNTLVLTKKLVECGNDVIYYNAPEFKEMIESTGAYFQNYLEKNDSAEQGLLRKPKTTMQIYDMKTALFQSSNLLALQLIIFNNLYQSMKTESFDFILYDSSTFAGRLLSQELEIPAISLFSTALLNREQVKRHPEILFESYFRFLEVKKYGDIAKGVSRIKKMFENELKKIYPLDDYLDLYMCEGTANIVFSFRNMIPNEDLFDENFYFIGPIFEEFYQKESSIKYKHEKKLVYINFGTTEILNYNLISYVFRELANLNIDVLFSLGCNRDINSFGIPPQNIIVKNFVSQKKVLSEADAIICSGSVNTINEAICFGVPIIAIPFAQADHYIMAKQVALKKIGICEKLDSLKGNVIKNDILEVLYNKQFKKNITKLKKEYDMHDSLNESVKIINRFCNKI